MKVLFVCSGNRVGISPIIRNQVDSLLEKGIKVDFFQIKGKGIIGYLRNVGPLYAYMRVHKYDLIHAHYSLSAFVASLSGAKPLVVSLMGSDVKAKKWYKSIIRLFAWVFSWSAIIMKSQDMYDESRIKRAIIIPNGIDLSRFVPLNRVECQRLLGWDCNKIHILFPANPARQEKNYSLAIAALECLQQSNWEIHVFVNVPNAKTPLWYNAANLVLMTSLWEGSPNAIKEAMACNTSVVATDVGDIKWLFGEEKGYYITDFTVENCVNQLKEALIHSTCQGKTNGRQRIIDLELDSAIIADKIVSLYKELTKNMYLQQTRIVP